MHVFVLVTSLVLTLDLAVALAKSDTCDQFFTYSIFIVGLLIVCSYTDNIYSHDDSGLQKTSP